MVQKTNCKKQLCDTDIPQSMQYLATEVAFRTEPLAFETQGLSQQYAHASVVLQPAQPAQRGARRGGVRPVRQVPVSA